MLKTNQPSLTNSATHGLYWGRAALVVSILALAAAPIFAGYSRCSFAQVTHMPCPGCGTTRAAKALLAFDFPAAWHFNPSAIFVILALGFFLLRTIFVVARDGEPTSIGQGSVGKGMLIFLVAAFVFQMVVWLLRFFGLFGGPVPV